MKRYLRLLTLTVGCSLLLSIAASGQEPAPVPETPEVPEVREVPEATEAPEARDTHIRRHKMGEKTTVKLEIGRDIDAAIKAQMQELKVRMAELQERMTDTGSKSDQATLEMLEEKLRELEELEAIQIDLPDFIITHSDEPHRILVSPDGSEVIILDPPGGRWRKMNGDKIAFMNDVYVDAGEWIEGAAVAILGNDVDRAWRAARNFGFIDSGAYDYFRSQMVLYLRDEVRDSRLDDAVLSLCAEMVLLGGLADDRDSARTQCEHAVTSGKAAELFAEMTAALGGPNDFVDNYDKYLVRAPVTRELHAEGIVQSVDTRAVGNAIIALGGGRRAVGERLNLSVGFSDIASIGTRLDTERPLAVIHAASEADADIAAENLLR